MPQILIHPEVMGLDAKGARLKLNSPSVRRADITFHSPDGTKVVLPAKSDMLLELNNQVWPDGQGQPDEVDDVMALWEKDYALDVLRDQKKFRSDIRSAKISRKPDEAEAAPKPPAQWDYLEISAEASVSDEQWQITVEEAINSFRDTRQNEKTRYVAGQQLNFVGMHGKRALFISETHENTGKRHAHILVNRIAFDMVNEQISASVDLSRKGNLETALYDLQIRLKERGVEVSMGLAGAIGNDMTRNQQERAAQTTVNEELTEAGGRSLNETTTAFSVEVPLGNGQTTFVAAPLTTDEAAMQRHLAALKENTLRAEREIERMKAEASANNRAVSMVEQALQALANERVLRADLETAKEQLGQLTTKSTSLEVVNTDLSKKLDAAETARQIQHEALVNIGTNLGGKAMLGLDVEQAEDLARGNVVAIGAIVDSLSDQVGTWNEALDQLPDDMAEALREDPFKGLNDLVDELLEKRELTTKLTTERDGLQDQLTAANKLNTELQGQLDAKAADLVDLQAKMAKREEEFASQMEEQVAKVRDAEAAVLRSEGTLQAKQQQLEAEQAKVKELTRTKEAIMDLMTSNDPHAAWEQSKDLFKDDVFANRAMGAFLTTSDKLEKAKQDVTKLEADVATLGQVKLDLEEAKATIEEHMGVVNDAGVADLRALGAEYKKTLAANSTLEQQIADLTAAAQVDQAAAEKTKQELEAARQEASTAKQAVATVQQSAEALRAEQEKATAEAERLAQELEQAKAQLAQASVPTVAPEMQASLELLMANPELASLVQEAVTTEGLLSTLIELANEVAGRPQGLQQVDRTQDGGEDYLGQSPDAKGPKKNDPDQGNNLG